MSQIDTPEYYSDERLTYNSFFLFKQQCLFHIYSTLLKLVNMFYENYTIKDLNLSENFNDVELLLSIISMIDLCIQILNKKSWTKTNFTPKIIESESEKELIETWVDSTIDVKFLQPMIVLYQKLIGAERYDESWTILQLLDSILVNLINTIKEKHNSELNSLIYYTVYKLMTSDELGRNQSK